jgi:hypothetical protein
MPEKREEVDEHFRCDAGHSDGEPCTRAVHVRKGRVALCGEHMDALRFGLEADELGAAVERLEHLVGEYEDPDRAGWLPRKLDALLAEAREEHHAAMLRARRFLEYADDGRPATSA